MHARDTRPFVQRNTKIDAPHHKVRDMCWREHVGMPNDDRAVKKGGKVRVSIFPFSRMLIFEQEISTQIGCWPKSCRFFPMPRGTYHILL